MCLQMQAAIKGSHRSRMPSTQPLLWRVPKTNLNFSSIKRFQHALLSATGSMLQRGCVSHDGVPCDISVRPSFADISAVMRTPVQLDRCLEILVSAPMTGKPCNPDGRLIALWFSVSHFSSKGFGKAGQGRLSAAQSWRPPRQVGRRGLAEPARPE